MRSTTLRIPKRPLAVLAVAALVTMSLLGLGAGAAFAATGGTISTVAGNQSAGYSGDGGPATAAQLNGPYGVAVDGVGNLFIADNSNSVVRRVDHTTQVITTFAGTGAPGYSGDGGPATGAQLNGPTDLAVDASGNLYIGDGGNGSVRKVTTGGTISTVAGNGSQGYSGDGGPATQAQLTFPSGILPIGNTLLISDYSDNRVRKVDAGGVISTYAGDGSQSSAGDGGLASAAAVDHPSQIAKDGAGNLYVAQSDGGDGSRVRKIDVSGVITTFAGTGSEAYSGDGGPATAAQLAEPSGVAVDASGGVLIADIVNNAIRRVDSSGVIHTIAGGSYGYSGDGGPAFLASMVNPVHLALDATGNLYLSDIGNNVVRKITAPIPTAPSRGVITDFDSDFRTDISVFRPSGGTWFAHQSGGGDTALSYGASGDIPVPADYDGDLKADQAVYNPSSGLWAVHKSSGGDSFVTFGGVAGDAPVPADYDGDGLADLAIFRASSGIWFVQGSAGNNFALLYGDVAGDIAVPADYDGDGRADFAIFRPSIGTWYARLSGSPFNDMAVSYGVSGDIPIARDYDGDRKADLAIFRPSTGLWAIHHSGGGPDTFVTYGGISNDVPIPADYDGDGKADIAIRRPSLGAWYVHQSTNNADAITTFGIGSDIALQLPASVRMVFF